MTLDVERVRRSFPILSRRVNDCPLVYLDNASTSLTPDPVLDAEAHFYRHIGGNVHRGRHALSEEASDAFESAREVVAKHIGASSREIVFTANTTAGMNLLAAGLDLPPDAEILTTVGEHHSALLPWRTRWAVRAIGTSALVPLAPEDLHRAIGKRSKALVLGHASNVTGLVQPAAALCRAARDMGLVSIIDAAQSAPHMPLTVHDIGCDFLAFSGHKMLGPTGIGALYGRGEAFDRLTPRDLGGGVVERVTLHHHALRPAPARFEAGTPNIAGALGLAAAASFLNAIGWQDLEEHARVLTAALRSKLAKLRGVRLLASPEPALPIVSVVLPNAVLAVEELAQALSDRYGIMTRGGLLCAHPLFDALGCPGGALRASAYLYNSVEEVDHFAESLAELLETFGG